MPDGTEPKGDYIRGERRFNRRYDMTLDLRWCLIRRRRIVECGTGKTVNLSTGGVLFRAGTALAAGNLVELSISLPVVVDNSSPIRLGISGIVVRQDARGAAIRIIQYEFHTIAKTARLTNRRANRE